MSIQGHALESYKKVIGGLKLWTLLKTITLMDLKKWLKT